MSNDLRPAKKLGFGLMRLPTLEDKSIDIGQVCAMVDAFLAKGCTYFDTAYVYHGGDSERAVRKILVERHPRNSFTIATKLPSWALNEEGDVQKVFDEQLERTGAGYFDYYLLHAVSAEKLPAYDKFDCWNWVQEMKKQGLIRHFGFSFHDSADVLDKILTDHPEVEFVQLQINYLDWEDGIVQSRKCYEVAVKHGVPVVVMEPVKGGTLAQLPQRASEVLKAADPNVSLASWALRFCGSLENVMMVLSGMSDTAQMEDNLNTMAQLKPLSEGEHKVIEKTVEAFHSVPTVPCTNCRYCVDGCPQSILIPDLIRALNNTKLYGPNDRARDAFKNSTKENGLPSSCVACGQCEGVCPQHLEIIQILKEIAGVFETK